MKLTAYIEPMGAVRMTRRGKFLSKTAKRYLTYKDHIGYQIKSAAQKTDKPCKVTAIFYMPIPQSWSKKQQREHIGKPHCKKPDIDNLVKGVFDAVNGICWKDDNQVVDLYTRKVYSDKPRIEIEIEEVGA